MSWNTTLCTFATDPNPALIPASVRLSYSDKTICVFDKFPKAKFHFLLLPRVVPPLTTSRTASLKALLEWDKNEAHKCLRMLQTEAGSIVKMIEDEMIKQYGFKWKIWTGFHAVPSMEHIHLHVISSDLLSDRLKNKKHYNSFHPSHGFFLHLDDVLSWFDLPDDEYRTRASLKAVSYEKLLKDDLRSWRTDEVFKTIPQLKEHMQSEWESEERKAVATGLRKAKRPAPESDADILEPPQKKIAATS